MSKIQVLRDIYKTLRNSIYIEALPMERPWQGFEIYTSKFGGLPYIPEDMKYPCTRHGAPMHLLAQINFIDMPYLEPFPRDGLLQIYIEDNEFYGMDYDEDSKDGFKVIYIPNVGFYGKTLDLNFLTAPSENFPITCPHLIKFQLTSNPISIMNPHFEKVFEQYIMPDQEFPDFVDLYGILIDRSLNHHIGGYASFINGDYEFLEKFKIDIDKYEVLLKIGSGKNINFGDDGIATFLILKEDLVKLDFSKVIYFWESS